MRSLTILTVLTVLAMALGACAPAVTPAPATSPAASATAINLPTISVPVTGGTETPAGSIPGDAAGTSTVEAALATATSEGSAGTGVTSGAGGLISTSTSANASEPFLVDQQGRTLYLFTMDVQNSGSSTCTADCLVQWQPVIVTGIPQAGTGVDAAKLGTITREDGNLQATYNGWPLYTYTGDMAPGDTSGQGMGSAWFLVSGAGNSIQP